MRKPLVYFLGLTCLALAGASFYFLETSMPAEPDAVKMASSRATETFEANCGNYENISVSTKVLFKNDDHLHVRSEIVASNQDSSLIDLFIYPSINLGLLSLPNIDVVGTKISCGV